jgi:lysophospholipase L1-like esterase
MTRAKSIALKLGLLLVSLAATLGVAELLLGRMHDAEMRALADDYEERAQRNDRCTERSADPRLIYRLVPNRCGANAMGYRDRERSFAKPDGVFRIVLIGDSVAAGEGVSAEEAFGAQLEVGLNANRGASDVEVVVLANTGYSTSQELVVLEEQALRYAPDLILWSYVLNDPADPVFHNANGDLGRFYYRPQSHLVHYLARKRFELGEQAALSKCAGEYHHFLHCAYWDRVAEDLGSLARLTQAEGVPTILLIHPVFQERRPFAAYTLRGLHANLAALAGELGLATVDLLGAFEGHDPEVLRQHHDSWFDPWHPSAEGHRVIARYVEAWLNARQLLPSPRD